MQSVGAGPSRRAVPVLAAAAGLLFLAGIMVVAFDHPIPVLAALLITGTAIAVVRYPISALGIFLFVAPFHTAIFAALQGRAHLAPGALGHWRDAIVVALFLRAVAERVRADGRLPLRNAGDNVLLFFAFAYLLIAVASPPRSSVYPALGRYVEGPMLLLAIKFLRPSRRQLWQLAAAMIAAASVIGAAAVIEWFGPRLEFHAWYGAPPPATGEPFVLGTSLYRSGSFIFDPLILGFYLAAATPFAVTVAVVRTRWRAVALVCVAACTAGLIATLVRSAYIGAGLGILLGLALTVRNPGIRFSLVGLAIVISGSIAASYTAAGSEVLIRPESNAAHQRYLDRDVRLLVAKPFGYGLGTTDRYRYHSGTETDPGQLGATESSWLARALEGGVQGLALLFITLFTTAMRLRAVRGRAVRVGDHAGRALAAGALGSMLAVFLSGLFLGVHEIVVEILLWGLPGIALAWSIAPKGDEPASPHASPSIGALAGESYGRA